MTGWGLGSEAERVAARDDRTRRALALVVGEARAALAMTHFAEAQVVVHIRASTLRTANGFVAVHATLNMLFRFVARVEACVDGDLSTTDAEALDAAIERLRRVDTRADRSLRRVAPLTAHERVTAARVWIGEAGIGRGHSRDDVHVAFTGWTCALRRSTHAGNVRASATPFGALAAACFATAEVFKSLVASSLPPDEAERFRERYVHAWDFSAWHMNPVTAAAASEELGDDFGLSLPMDQVLQVGAGAVGNASALAFASTEMVTGTLSILDPKRVDVRNLNRCFFFTEQDVGVPKTEVLDRAVPRAGLEVRGRCEEFQVGSHYPAAVFLSTVDNNQVRHRMQEALPDVLVQGSTGGTAVAISVHTPGNGRSCLVCRHASPEVGLTQRVPLSLEEASALTGLSEAEITAGVVGGEAVISDALIALVTAVSPPAGALLERAREAGHDLCGALGDLRGALGPVRGPQEASVPFVSNLAGVLAAAEVVKSLLRASGVSDVPVLDNVLVIDLAHNYARHAHLAFCEPPRGDCTLCQQRGDAVSEVYARRRSQSGAT
ncbi:ThiF family adenylyltransferase [Gemmatimonas sp.]|uniref:ThiF family adenylyltransferase n=1 Tax=Gemmatimonas sp. TaxID=1962908 RepID=UPI00286E2A39|nr:ThiF family adenylyltransferase [Gemmatimonas sp.]